MNEERHASLKNIVKTGMNAEARLRDVEDVLKRMREGSLDDPSFSSKEERYKIIWEELSGIVESTGLPPEIKCTDEAVAYLLGDFACCCKAAGDPHKGRQESGDVSGQHTACSRTHKNHPEDDDDWVDLAREPSTARKVEALSRTADTGIRRLVIRKSPRTQK